ncbi:hypothetical protein HDU90_004658 [Geranomyces variabilis]|nr:hypothetical protein HDU90_004658 [Geranomyces variabilis]
MTVLRSPVARLVIATVVCMALYLLLDSGQWAFSHFVLLPPYFRFLLLVNLGIWAWGVNVHGLSATGIDVARLMDDGIAATSHQHRLIPTVDGEDDDDERTNDGDDKVLSHRPISYGAIYGIACVFTGVTILSMVVFLNLAEKWGEEGAEIIPALTYVLLIGLVCWPYAGFYQRERNAFLRSLKRTVTGGFASAVPFCDVIFADILTSFSKVMGDLQIVFADFVTDESEMIPVPTTSVAPSQTGTFNAVDFVSPLIVCIPYLLRLRQCISEYSQTPKTSVRARHFANAIKYLSGLPVVMSGFTINWMEAQYHRRHGGSQLEGDDVGLRDTDVTNTRHGLNVAIGTWIFFSLVHSIYTLYWDVVMDWHLGNMRSRHRASGSPITGPALLSPRTAGLTVLTFPSGGGGAVGRSSAGPRYPMFLRPTMHFRPVWLYYVAIVVDAVLRFSWVVRVTLLWRVADSVGTVSAVGNMSGTKEALVAIDVALKLLEIVRRWMWTFLRIESLLKAAV